MIGVRASRRTNIAGRLRDKAGINVSSVMRVGAWSVLIEHSLPDQNKQRQPESVHRSFHQETEKTASGKRSNFSLSPYLSSNCAAA